MDRTEGGFEITDTRLLRSWLIVAAVLGAYATAWNGAFQFDDYNVIVDNPSVHSFSAWFSGLFRGIRPLLKLSYTLNWTLGPGLFGFHLFNIAVHAANSVLVFILSRKLHARFSLSHRDAGGAAFGAALLFAVHPIQTESVTYICGRSMSFMALFYLGSMTTYVYGTETGKRLHYRVLSPLLFLAALAVRETAVTLPLALLVWEAASGRSSWRERASNLAPHAVLLGAVVVALFLHPGYRELIGASLATRSMTANLMSQATAVSYLLSRLFLVHRLNADPALPVASGWTPLLLIEALFLLFLLLAGFMLLRKRPWLGFGLLWFFLHLTPTNSVVPRLDLASERHLYLAAWGLFLAASIEIVRLRNMNTPAARPVIAAALLALLVFAAFTLQRNQAYRSEVSFWEDAVQKTPENARAHNNLGYAYFEAGRSREAAEEYRRAISLRPGYERAEVNLRALLAIGQRTAADGKGSPDRTDF